MSEERDLKNKNRFHPAVGNLFCLLTFRDFQYANQSRFKGFAGTSEFCQPILSAFAYADRCSGFGHVMNISYVYHFNFSSHINNATYSLYK